MGFKSVAEVAQAYEDGRTNYGQFRKSFVSNYAAGNWVDCTMMNGLPPAFFYSGDALAATPYPASSALFVGDSVGPQEKFISQIGVTGTSTSTEGACLMLCDFLLFYPGIDTGVLDTQNMINDTPLPRYPSGEGVRIVPIAQTQQSFQSFGMGVAFTRQDDGIIVAGVGGGQNSAAAGTVLTVAPGTTNTGNSPFISFPNSVVTGTKKIDYVYMQGEVGGLMVLALVKPLATIVIGEANVPTELDFVSMNSAMPRIYDGARLGFLLRARAGLSGASIFGHIRTIWK